jgi:hypothetical protein
MNTIGIYKIALLDKETPISILNSTSTTLNVNVNSKVRRTKSQYISPNSEIKYYWKKQYRYRHKK